MAAPHANPARGNNINRMPLAAEGQEARTAAVGPGSALHGGRRCGADESGDETRVYWLKWCDAGGGLAVPYRVPD